MDFRVGFLKCSSFRGYAARTLYKCTCLNFPKLLGQFWRKILRNGKISIMTIQKLPVSIDFSTQISINSLAMVGAAPPTRYKCTFLNFCPNFCQKFDNFKFFEKIAKFPLKFSKNCKFFIDFYKFFETSLASGGPTRRPPYKPSLGGPRSPPPEKKSSGR